VVGVVQAALAGLHGAGDHKEQRWRWGRRG
jgi:hypothetical protein